MDTSKSSLSSKFSQKPSISSMDNSKRINDSTENYSLFEVNYDGMFDELPLRTPPLRTPPLKKRRKGIAFQGKNLYADFLHVDCVDDHFDVLDHWSYEDVYGGGYFNVSGSFKVFDCTEEPVGCDDGSLPVRLKMNLKMR
ncbi:hypothetical protein Tco_0445132 [Tanacetum coccineum]